MFKIIARLASVVTNAAAYILDLTLDRLQDMTPSPDREEILLSATEIQ